LQGSLHHHNEKLLIQVNGVTCPYQVWDWHPLAKMVRLAVGMILLIDIVTELAAVIAAVLAT
jgi:hypothetical protein